jgi:Protein of unknown function (DUF1214)
MLCHASDITANSLLRLSALCQSREQIKSPGKDKEANWLPAPDGPIYLVMRLYWPKEEALNGTWEPAPIARVQ